MTPAATPAATAALIAGEVTVGFAESIALTPHIKSGRLRAIAMTSPQRSALFPDLPTVAETIEGYTAGPWYGVLAPAKTPASLITRLNREIVNILRTPEIRAGIAGAGAEVVGSTPEELALKIKEESERWARVIRESAIISE